MKLHQFEFGERGGAVFEEINQTVHFQQRKKITERKPFVYLT